MNSVFEIIKIFSDNSYQIPDKSVEDFYTLTLIYKIEALKDLIPQDGINITIPSGDILSIDIYDSDELDDDVILKYNSSNPTWEEFIKDYAHLDKNISRLIKIEISKNIESREHAIYCFELFRVYLESSDPFSILGQLSKFLNSDIAIFEFQEEQIPSFSTSMFYFHGKGKKILQQISNKSTDERKRCIDKASFLCSSNEFKGELLPDDIFPMLSDNRLLRKIFDKLSTLYSLCFLLDYTYTEQNSLIYRLNGFKSIAGKWSLAKDIDKNTSQIINRIYTWGYNGGDIDDKILIIRNILSLNIDTKSLVFHSNTFDAILSNYKIYQKENVRQYLDLRNNIVKEIQSYQDSILNAIDNFEDTFKKMSISLLSFFFISIILSILSFSLSSNQHIPDAAILFCIAISVISLLYYGRERKWLKERIEHLENRFKASKKYYEDLLGKEELKNLFDPENESGHEDIQFRDKKIKEFSNLWRITTYIIIAILIIILVLNHIHPLQEILNLLKQLISVSIKQ